MKRQHDPLHLDVAAFAGEGASLLGHWPGPSLDRLAELQAAPQDAPLSDVAWQVQGERRPVTGGEPELWLALKADTVAWLTCQRCLQPFKVPLAIDRRIRFVRGETQAEALDAESDDDVLALARSTDVRALLEDELLLALPLVPRHEVCPRPLPMAVQADAPEDEPARPNPFAALQALKSGHRKG